MRGGDKTLMPVDGQPLLTRLATMAAATGWPAWVALPPDRPDRWRAVEGTGAHPVPVEIASLGMSATLKVGAAAATGGDPETALMLLLADMPGIAPADLTRLIEAFAAAGEDRAVRAATPDGRPGHPVVLPARLVARLAKLDGDAGAKELLRREDAVDLVPLDDDRARLDLDTPEDWADWAEGRAPT